MSNPSSPPIAKKASPAKGNLKRRVISAIILLIIAFSIISVGGWVFVVAIAAVSGLMAHEWNRLVMPREHGLPLAAHVASNVFALSAMVIFQEPVIAMAILCLGALVTGFVAQAHQGQFLWSATGVIYTGLPCMAMVWLRAHPESGFIWVLGLVLVVAGADIGAYFAGRGIGGPKLAPRISPSKTWAGLLGGVVLAALVASVLATIVEKPIWIAVGLGAALAVIAQGGDLIESFVKRRFDVKDSGSLIPGHGGILDRVDGLMFATMAVALVIWAESLAGV